jgi:hypothetical protein
MDQDMHQAPDWPSSRPVVPVGRSVAKRREKDLWVLLAAYLAIGSHPSVVVEPVAKHSTEDRGETEGTLRPCGHVSEHVSNAPLGTQRGGVPLLVIEHRESLGEVEHLVSFCLP